MSPGPQVSGSGLTQAAHTGPAAAVAGRPKPKEDEEKQRGGSNYAGPFLKTPPHSRFQQATLPSAHLRMHRKHFLGLSDSALNQSLPRNFTLLHKT